MRLVSMYLVAQHLRYESSESADWSLDRFSLLLREVEVVNRAFNARLAAVPHGGVIVEALKLLAQSADVPGQSAHKRGMARLAKVVRELQPS